MTNLAEWVAWLGSDDNLAPAYARSCAAKFFEAGKVEPAWCLIANHASNLVRLPMMNTLHVKLRIVRDPRFGWAEMEAAAALPSPAPRFRVAAADALSHCMFPQLLEGADEWTRDRRKNFIRAAQQAEATLAGLEGLGRSARNAAELEGPATFARRARRAAPSFGNSGATASRRMRCFSGSPEVLFRV
jgi:hypothetical protein